MSTVHVAIGNSDDRLTQAEWSAYWQETDLLIRRIVEDRAKQRIYGAWVSPSTEPFQNACWAFGGGLSSLDEEALRKGLRVLAAKYRQESIAWNQSDPIFLSPIRTPF